MPHELDEALALRMHEAMVRLQTMDVIFYEAQRQAMHLQTPASVTSKLEPCHAEPKYDSKKGRSWNLGGY